MQETLKQPDPPSHSCFACGAALRGSPAFCPSCGAALRPLTGRLQAEQVLARRYRIARLVARGGMGAVYRAEDTRLGGAPVAVKEMSSGFVGGDTEAFQRAVADFRREAAMLARLRHPHLPRVSDQFDEQGKHYLVMEFIAGHTLLEALRRAGGRLPLALALDYADQLCDVLAYLHSQSPPIIYRDLKPSNVMVVTSEDRGSRIEDRAFDSQSSILDPRSSQIVLIDFGIARFYRPGQAGDTAIYGTTGYAPPEQYGRGQTDPRTDIYALGVLLHQLLTGHDPTATPFALPPARALNPAIPPHVADAIARATAADRAARFDDIAALRAALRPPAAPVQAVMQGAAARAAAAAPGARPAPPRRHISGPTWVVVGIAAALLVGALALGLLLWPLRGGRQAAPTVVPAVVVVPTRTIRPLAVTGQPDITPAIDTGSDSITPQTTAPGENSVLLRPSAVSGSGTAAPGIDAQQNPVRYDPENAIDGQPDTTWRVEGDGVNQWIQLDFAGQVDVTAIGIIPGYDKVDPSDGTDRFFQNRIVKIVRFEFSDGGVVRASFSRDRSMQTVPIGNIRTRSIRIVVEDTYPPPPAEQGGRDFTPISEVQVQGTP